jgi:hypothetical protein
MGGRYTLLDPLELTTVFGPQLRTETDLKNGVFWDVTPCGSQETPFFIVTVVKTSNLTWKQI